MRSIAEKKSATTAKYCKSASLSPPITQLCVCLGLIQFNRHSYFNKVLAWVFFTIIIIITSWKDLLNWSATRRRGITHKSKFAQQHATTTTTTATTARELCQQALLHCAIKLREVKKRQIWTGFVHKHVFLLFSRTITSHTHSLTHTHTHTRWMCRKTKKGFG